MSAKIRNALALYAPLRDIENIEIRMHDAVLYDSIHGAESDFMVNQRSFGVPAANSSVLELRQAEVGDMTDACLDDWSESG